VFSKGGGEVALYKVIFLGLSVAGPEEESRLLKGLQKKFSLTPEKAENLFQRVPIVIKKGISKEEMERYVRAFEEMGGRVQVEEEPATESTAIPRPPEPEKKPYSRMITCPQCGFEQSETDECMKCGVVISKFMQYQEMARSMEGQVREISSEDKAAPWESGEGFFRAFYRTTRDVLFSPTQFFKKFAAGEGYLSPLIYGVITGVIGVGVTIFWTWLFLARLLPIERLLPFQFSTALLGILIPLPFQMALSILIGSFITHLCLMIVGGNNSGFRTTFRVMSYSFSANILGIIPFIGAPIGGIYFLILTILGVREGHEISTGKAVLAVFLPTLVGVGLAILLAIVLPLLFGSLSFMGGQGV
jgi:hypothetical protein